MVMDLLDLIAQLIRDEEVLADSFIEDITAMATIIQGIHKRIIGQVEDIDFPFHDDEGKEIGRATVFRQLVNPQAGVTLFCDRPVKRGLGMDRPGWGDQVRRDQNLILWALGLGFIVMDAGFQKQLADGTGGIHNGFFEACGCRDQESNGNTGIGKEWDELLDITVRHGKHL